MEQNRLMLNITVILQRNNKYKNENLNGYIKDLFKFIMTIVVYRFAVPTFSLWA